MLNVVTWLPGQPEMMELALAVAELLSADLRSVATGAPDQHPPEPDRSNVRVVQLVGATDGCDCVCTHPTYVVAGVVHKVDGNTSLGSIRTAMRIRSKCAPSPAGAGQFRGLQAGNVRCATVDGPVTAASGTREQLWVALGCVPGGVGLLVASGVIDAQVAHWCTARGVVVLQSLPRAAFRRLVTLCGSRATSNVYNLQASCVAGRGLNLELWEAAGWSSREEMLTTDTVSIASCDSASPRGASCSDWLVISAADEECQGGAAHRSAWGRWLPPRAPVVTAVVCGSTETAVAMRAATFWKCLRRLCSTASSRRVLPGGGCFVSLTPPGAKSNLGARMLAPGHRRCMLLRRCGARLPRSQTNAPKFSRLWLALLSRWLPPQVRQNRPRHCLICDTPTKRPSLRSLQRWGRPARRVPTDFSRR